MSKTQIEIEEKFQGNVKVHNNRIFFTKNTIRKAVIQYVGNKGYCCKCKQDYVPNIINKIKNHHFGHNFKAWVVYQRLFLRLPYDIIKSNLNELFNEKVSQSTVADIVVNFSQYYKATENRHQKLILQSPFIHVDETQVNILGANHYVWIFTNGEQVIFRKTETREIEVVRELLKDYKGILIADFYPGYDSLKCKHQKCWVHLIRDLNEDLWKNPYDIEYEQFIIELRNLILPIFTTIEKYGSKKRHLNKYRKKIDNFYYQVIMREDYNSEITIKYQTRLKKHWANLFTFLESDDIPWNNNMAERGLRQIAVQRKISMSFGSGINNYLLFLGIMQTCRFQNKSFLKFLISGKKAFV